MENLRDSSENEFDTSLSFGTMRETTTSLLEGIQEELDKLAVTGKISSHLSQLKKKPKQSQFSNSNVFVVFFFRASTSVKVCKYARLSFCSTFTLF